MFEGETTGDAELITTVCEGVIIHRLPNSLNVIQVTVQLVKLA
jgi:hypothetical protein